MTKSDRYHHGDLRDALVRSALELLSERGPEGVTLREAASRVGVSHAAPYHHFSNKGHLMEALAVESYRRFTAALREAWESTSGPSIARFRSLGLAYVRFALEHPAEFRLMNRPGLPKPTGEESGVSEETAERSIDGEPTPLAAAARESYQVLLDGVRASQRDGFIGGDDPEPAALAAWSAVHGLAVLLLDGRLGEEAKSVDEAMKLAELVTATLGQGLIAR